MGPHRAEANLGALIESTEDLIWSVDLNYGLLTFNRAWQDDIRCDGKRRTAGRHFERQSGGRAVSGTDRKRHGLFTSLPQAGPGKCMDWRGEKFVEKDRRR
jgi:hypothetical protein